MDQTMATVADLFRAVHRQLREVVSQVDEGDLDWVPGPDMSSIAILVVHTTEAELDNLHVARGLVYDRDRDAEFRTAGTTKADLLAVLDQADARLAEHAEAITADDLAATRERPGRDPQTGLYWLLFNYGHAREHLAHAQMTAQLRQQRATAS